MRLEQNVTEHLPEIKDLGEGVVYRGNRFSAAARFAMDATKINSDIYLDSLKDLRMWVINPTPLIGPVLAFAIAYVTTPVTSFAYSAISLKYSQDKKGYVFNRITRDRLNIIG